ncbi:MAG: TusE/DsrC/DsvC family sulfur relay protein [Gemmatimonadaceae bacterium]
MTTAMIAGHSVKLNDDGFMIDPQEWTPDIAEEIAKQAGVTLTERHWKVIEFCRRDAAEKGTAPGLRRITAEAGVPTKELYQLFPKGPGILAAKISGLTKPKSCV